MSPIYLPLPHPGPRAALEGPVGWEQKAPAKATSWLGLVRTKHSLRSCSQRRAQPSGLGGPCQQEVLSPGCVVGPRLPRAHQAEQEVGQGSTS